MKLGVVLPCTLLYGGVKRFMELGNIFMELGHEFTVYSPDGQQPDWFLFKGDVKQLEALCTDELDALFFTEYRYINEVQTSLAKRKIFYHVSNDKQVKKIAKVKNLETIACSTNIYEFDKKHGLNSFKAIGGVNLGNYTAKSDYHIPADRPIHVLAYGRLGMSSKGTKYIVRACEKLYKQGFNVKLLLFDTIVNEKGRKRIQAFNPKVPYEFILNQPIEKNSELFNRADIFVAAEGQAGWSNTVAEAMASGLPVVATTAGTKDLLFDGQTGLVCWRNSFSIRRNMKKLIKDENLRATLGRNGRANVENFDWRQLAQKLNAYLAEPAPNSN